MWDDDVSSIIFTRIKYGISEELKEKYPKLFFTTSNKTPTEPKFPTVYIQELSGSETGKPLNSSNINLRNFGFQVDVTDNVSQQNAKTVMSEIKRIMKSMQFDVSNSPKFNNTDVYRSTARFTRLIGEGDIL